MEDRLSRGANMTGKLTALVVGITPSRPEPGRPAFQLRFLIGASLLGALIGLITLPIAVVTGQLVTARLIAVFIAALLAQLAAARRGAPVRVLLWTVLATMGAFVVAACLATRELDPSQLAWLLLIPLAARVLDAPRPDDAAPPRPRAMLRATGLALLAGVFVVAAHEVGLTFDQPAHPAPTWMAVTDFGSLALSAVGLVYLHDLSTRETVAELQRLRALLSICAWCKQIRDDGRWMPLESYVAHRTRSDLSHGICPSCEAQHFPPDDAQG